MSTMVCTRWSVYVAALLLLASLASTISFAMGGDGTPDHPYRIVSCMDLHSLGASLSSSYALVNDVDCTGFNFTMINDDTNPFTGTFDGRGHRITGLTISHAGILYTGLFGYADSGAVIANVTLQGVDITGGTYTGALVGFASGITINNVSVNGSVFVPSTYHISQLVGGRWQEIYTHSFGVQYSTAAFPLDKSGNNITLRMVQEDLPFGDIDQAKLTCGNLTLTPDYAVYKDTNISVFDNESVLDDISEIDNNVAVAHETPIEVSWDVSSCSEPITFYLTANEYGIASPFRFPDGEYVNYTLGTNSGPIDVDGILNGSDALPNYSYAPFWSPVTGHPPGYTYAYVKDDAQNVYVALDITMDNSNDYGKDWAEVAVLTGSGVKKFRINDTDATWGVCGFGRSDKVSYKHAMCEFKIPKSEIGSISELRFAIEYYGTGSGSTGIGGLVGDAESSTNITGCSFIGNVSAPNPSASNIGGLVGGTASTAKITNSYVQANVYGGAETGGLVGWMQDSSVVANSYATGNVTLSGTGGFVGGLVGYVASGLVTNSFADASVSGVGAGGLVGALEGSSSVITNSYAAGNTTRLGGDCGGLVSDATHSFVTNSFAVASVSGTAGSVGGLVGDTFNFTATNSYWDVCRSGQSTCTKNGNPSGCSGVNDACDGYFYSSSNAPLSGWDFTNVWRENAGAYPDIPTVPLPSPPSFSMAFMPPTPDDGATATVPSPTINISIGKNASSCTLDLRKNGTSQLWSNVRHLGIGSGGIFDYNASQGVNNYSSFYMNDRRPVVSGAGFNTCYLRTSGNSACEGPDWVGESDPYLGGDAVSMGGGDEFLCYVLSDGNSVCHGDNSSGESTGYAGGDAIAAAGGESHMCYLLDDGNSTCFGWNDDGESINYSGGDAIALSAGGYNTCYLLRNGNSICYGRNNFGQSHNYTGGDAIAVSAGLYHTCYLLSNGSSACYGRDLYGEGTNYTGGDAIAVSTGEDNDCYLLSNGNSVCDGFNFYGEAVNYTGGDAIAVSVGYDSVCYVLTSGNSLCYGYNDDGESGNYTGGDIRMPSIGMQVANADADTMASSTVTGLGNGVYTYSVTCTDPEGNSNTTANRTFTLDFHSSPSLNFTAPTPSNATILHAHNVTVNVTVSENATSCSLNMNYSLALNGSRLWNNVRHLGIYGGTFNYNASTGINGYASFNMLNRIPVAAGNEFTCYLFSNGSSACYGSYLSGGSTYTMPGYDGGDAVALAARSNHVCYVRSNGSSACYGDNGYGQSTNYTGGNAIATSAGDWFTCYLLSNGSGACYGDYNNGTLTDYVVVPLSANYSGGNAISVASGDNHVCYLLSDGNSACYGRNEHGESTNYTGNDAIAISAGNDFTCYLLSSGNSTCYGWNDYGRVASYTGGNAIATSSGVWHNCYLLSNGNSQCYGDAAGYTGTDAIAMASGGYHDCYLLSNGDVRCYGLNDHGQSNGYTGGDLLMPFASTTGIPMDVHNAGAGTSAGLSISDIADGTYLYSVECTGMFNNTNTTTNRTLYVETQLLISDVSHLVLNDSAVAVAWSTDKSSNSTVIYGTSPALGSTASNTTPGRFHNITLTNLTPMTLYYYNVTSCTFGGTCSTAGPFTFFLTITPPSVGYALPTPANGTVLDQQNMTVNVTVSENVSSCNFSLSFAPLWNNVRHLGIYGGGFDYNASMGAGGYASFNADNIRTVATGASYACYLLNNGTSACYGDNTLGQAANYSAGDAMAVAAGLYHTCYLLSSGNSACYGSTPYPANYSGGDAVAVSTSGSRTCYLLGSGNSVCYGDNTWNQSTNYSGDNAIALSLGGSHTCYLLSSGNSVCYGLNDDGQSANYSGGNAIAVAAGAYHTCYLLSNGNSVCYGLNDHGQSTNYTGANVLALAAGKSHTCYLLSNGNSACYGDNTYNQSTDYAGGDAIEISSGSFQTCYVRMNGGMVCYGTGAYGAYAGLDVKLPFASALSVTGITNANENTTILSTISRMKHGVTYTYEVTCTNRGGLSNHTEMRNVRVAGNESVSLISPANASSSSASTLTFNFNAVNYVGSPLSCILYLDGAANQTNSSVANDTPTSFTVSGVVTGQHNWSVGCSDLANNTASSELRVFTVTPRPAPPQPSPSSHCANDESCAANQACTGGRCTSVECPCGVITNHDCVAYECCANTDCGEEGVCVNNVCVTSQPNACTSDSNCDPLAYCNITAGAPTGRCTAVECPCGNLTNHRCAPYECCGNSDCTGGRCQDHACTTVPLPSSSSNACKSSSICNSTFRCDIAAGAENGSCTEVTGQCGYAANHAWVRYACGPEPDCPSCPSGSSCSGHQCVPEAEMNISAPDTGFVGEGVQVTVTNGTGACGRCEVIWTSPSGRTGTGTTDANGTYVIPLNEKGTYRVVVAKDPTKSASVNALSRLVPPEGQSPLVLLLSEASPYAPWLLVLLLTIVGLVLYLRLRPKGR